MGGFSSLKVPAWFQGTCIKQTKMKKVEEENKEEEEESFLSWAAARPLSQGNRGEGKDGGEE